MSQALGLKVICSFDERAAHIDSPVCPGGDCGQACMVKLSRSPVCSGARLAFPSFILEGPGCLGFVLRSAVSDMQRSSGLVTDLRS